MDIANFNLWTSKNRVMQINLFMILLDIHYSKYILDIDKLNMDFHNSIYGYPYFDFWITKNAADFLDTQNRIIVTKTVTRQCSSDIKTRS